MTLFKRHIGRRVAGIGVGVALLVLGLEAPAFAVPPTIASFTPSSGPAGCVIVITGTNFDNPAASAVDIGGTDLPDFSVISGTEIWATVVLGATGTVHVTNATGTANSASDFTNVDPGGCSPTITSFLPDCGFTGTAVTITGTNLLQDAGGTADSGGDVRFAPYPALPAGGATHTVPVNETPTTLSVLVPSGAADGPIRVNTFPLAGGQAFSVAQFQVEPPDCEVEGVVTHARSVTLSLRKHLVARGAVSVADEFTECVASVPVKIQRRVSGAWRNVGSTTTNDTGAYKKRIKDKPGKYRARATKVSIGDPVTDICAGARSPVRRHTH